MFGSVFLNMANFEREIQEAHKKGRERALLSRGESEEVSPYDSEEGCDALASQSRGSALSSSLPSVKTLTHRLTKPLSRKLSHKQLSEK